MSAGPIFLAIAAAVVVYLLVRHDRRHGAQDHAGLHTSPLAEVVYLHDELRARRDHSHNDSPAHEEANRA